jgi:hypothetical protein
MQRSLHLFDYERALARLVFLKDKGFATRSRDDNTQRRASPILLEFFCVPHRQNHCSWIISSYRFENSFSSGIMSSPIKRPRPIFAAHKRDEVEKFAISGQVQEITLENFWQELCYEEGEFYNGILKVKFNFKRYMNAASSRIRKSFQSRACQSFIVKLATKDSLF